MVEYESLVQYTVHCKLKLSVAFVKFLAHDQPFNKTIPLVFGYVFLFKCLVNNSLCFKVRHFFVIDCFVVCLYQGLVGCPEFVVFECHIFVWVWAYEHFVREFESLFLLFLSFAKIFDVLVWWFYASRNDTHIFINNNW